MTNSEKIEKGCSLLLDGLAGALSDAIKILTSALNTLASSISNIINDSVLNKKITKKKFKKLLQSKGIQRNEINRLLQDNKEQYTIARLIKIVKERG